MQAECTIRVDSVGQSDSWKQWFRLYCAVLKCAEFSEDPPHHHHMRRTIRT